MPQLHVPPRTMKKVAGPWTYIVFAVALFWLPVSFGSRPHLELPNILQLDPAPPTILKIIFLNERSNVNKIDKLNSLADA